MPGNKVSHRQGQRSSRSQFSLGRLKTKCRASFCRKARVHPQSQGKDRLNRPRQGLYYFYSQLLKDSPQLTCILVDIKLCLLFNSR